MEYAIVFGALIIVFCLGKFTGWAFNLINYARIAEAQEDLIKYMETRLRNLDETYFLEAVNNKKQHIEGLWKKVPDSARYSKND